jgi:GntR family transcriptional regulator/MocR family aminotransferase
MTIPGLKIDLDSGVPVYRQIADGVRAAALDGRLEPDDRLPATRDLARRLGVNRNTVINAYEALAREGWVRSHTGRGTFLVSHAAPDAPQGDAGTWFTAFSRSVEGVATSGLRSILSMATSGEGISFVASYPAGDLIPTEALGQAVQSALREHGASILTYGPTAGQPELREWIAARMRDQDSPVTAEDVLVTNGAQQALELVFRSFLERGDAVVIEEPTYTGALSVLSSIGARAVGVPLDEEGIRPDLLQVALERHRPKLLYVQPTFHNPTARVMGEARRRELLTLAGRYRCPVVEDDWAGDLRFEGRDQPSLHALDGGRHVIYLSTFSKKLMPGLRIGWVAAPREVLERLVEMKRVQDCGTSPLLQSALEHFLRGGGLEEHLRRIRPAYRRRRDCMIGALQRHFPHEARWHRPDGGLFTWVTLPDGVDGGELFVAACREGVLYSRGELFHVDGSGRDTMRLTYSTASLEEIEAGVAKLGALIGERWPRRPGPEPRTAVEAMPIF